MKEKYWYALLKKWRDKKRDGFSVPYLIGSQKYLPAGPRQSIQDMIVDMTEHVKPVYIANCDEIGGVIIGVKDLSKQELLGYFPSYKGKAQNTFFITSGVSYFGETVESMIATLENTYLKDIKEGKFSLNNNKYGDFSPKEVEFIKEVFADNCT